MENIFKKICVFTSLAIVLASLTACSGDNNKVKKEILDSDSDKEASIAILTDSKKDDFATYDMAQSIKEQYDVKLNNKLTKAKIINYSLPEKGLSTYKKDKNDLLVKIKNNNDIKALVVSTSDLDIISDINKLKKSRKDLVLLSADQATTDIKNIDEKESGASENNLSKALINTFDMNFKTDRSDRTKNIAELAKTMGADRTVVIVDEENMSPTVKSNIEGLEKETKSYDMAYEEVKLPKLEEGQKRAYISNLIDDIAKKYGDKVSYYSTSKVVDDVLVSRITENKYYVSELSEPNRLTYILNKFGIKYIHRQRCEYAYLNSQVSTYLNRINNSSNRIGSSSADPKNHTLRTALELAVNITGKDTDIKKCYNPYFLEKISTFRTNINAGFANVGKGTNNYKFVYPDQYIY
ncbi:MAG: DUF3798 domain-containing protein [Peptostreptococcus stomatis]